MSVSTGFRVGVFGGTFDPVHNGHLAVARQCLVALGLQRVLVIPSSRPPHREPPSASPEQRLAMVVVALAGGGRVVASDVEVARGGFSYTVDTLRQLHAMEPEAELGGSAGADAAVDFAAWHERAVAAGLARFAVFNRTGSEQPAPARLAEFGLPGSTEVLTVESPAVSASAVRERLRQGSDVSSEVPDAVLAYIRAQHLYGA